MNLNPIGLDLIDLEQMDVNPVGLDPLDVEPMDWGVMAVNLDGNEV